MPKSGPNKRKRVPKHSFMFMEAQGIGWHVSFRDPKTGSPTRHRFGIREKDREPVAWEVKAERVHLLDTSSGVSQPTDRCYWFIVARNPATGEYKYLVSNASASATLKEMMTAAFARWHVEKWFERAKQEAGFGAFEVRTYKSLIRHWLCCRLVMYFLATQTQRLRGEKSAYHTGAGGRCSQYVGLEDLEPVAALVG